MRLLCVFRTSGKHITLIKKYKRHIFPLFAIGFISSSFRIALPYLSKYLIDASFLKRDMTAFSKVSAASVLIFLVSLIFKGVEGIVRNRVQVEIKHGISSAFLRKVLMLDMLFFHRVSSGENIYRLVDTERVSIFLSEQVPRAMIDAALLSCMLGMTFFISPLLMLPFILFLPLVISWHSMVLRKRWMIYGEIWKTQVRLYKIIEEIFLRMPVIKAFKNELVVRHKYMRELLVSLRLKAKNARSFLMISLTSDFVFQGFLGVISVMGGWMIIKGHLSLGQYTAFLLYAGQLIFLAGSLSSFLNQIMQDVFSTNEFLEIMDMQPSIKEIPEAQQIGADGLREGIEFNNVTFGYQPEKHVLEKLSFKISSGHWHALAGPSGCGKTTIINLLLRFYDPAQGHIVIDGLRLSEVAGNSLGRNIAMASQEPFLFSGSIRDNIACGEKKFSIESIREAARIADVHNLITSLPQGFDTVIGEGSSRLSEGQKQKISIARALIRKPDILIFDEAMASLDSESESRIIEEIRKLQLPLVVLVSHRLSTIMACDYVHYLKTPNRMITSAPSELLENDADFRALFGPQLDKHSNR